VNDSSRHATCNAEVYRGGGVNDQPSLGSVGYSVNAIAPLLRCSPAPLLPCSAAPLRRCSAALLVLFSLLSLTAGVCKSLTMHMPPARSDPAEPALTMHV
jgi:hypothetical protein